MGLYRDHVFPRLMDWVMSSQVCQRLRSDLLQDAHGDVLEVGFACGGHEAQGPLQDLGETRADLTKKRQELGIGAGAV